MGNRVTCMDQIVYGLFFGESELAKYGADAE
jgi:hypothetical protein